MLNLLRMEMHFLGSRQEKGQEPGQKVTCKVEVLPAAHHNPASLVIPADWTIAPS